jgi:hypothetical protein
MNPVIKPRKNFTGITVPKKTTSCSLFRSQRFVEQPEEDMCHTDLYAYIKVFGTEDQRRRLVLLKSKVRRKHLLLLYREVRGNNRPGGGGINNNNNRPGGGGINNNNNRPGGGGGNNPGGGGAGGGAGGGGGGKSPRGGGRGVLDDYFTSDSYMLSRTAYDLSKDPNYRNKLAKILPGMDPARRNTLMFQFGRLMESRIEYGTLEDYERGMNPVLGDPPDYSASDTRKILKQLFRPVL